MINKKIIAMGQLNNEMSKDIPTLLSNFFQELAPLGYAGIVHISRANTTLINTSASPSYLTGPQLTTNTRINIASIGKFFTSTAIFQLAEQSEQSLDDFLNQSLADIFTSDEHWQNIHILLPPFDKPADRGRSLTDEEIAALKEAADNLTIRSLLTHSSGLARVRS